MVVGGDGRKGAVGLTTLKLLSTGLIFATQTSYFGNFNCINEVMNNTDPWLSELSDAGRYNHADISALSQYHLSMFEPPRRPSHESHVTTLDDRNVS